MSTALKFDGGKPPIGLIPRSGVEGPARVLGFGARKYAAHNWRQGFAWSRLADATLRHVFAWLDGEDLDPESQLNHIDHALCELMFLREHIEKNLGQDDRYRPSAEAANEEHRTFTTPEKTA